MRYHAPMIVRDWSDPVAPAFTAQLDGAYWAWEFLRRNPGYQAEWRVFMDVWRSLEADYGRPPNRDFCAWKLDPRAWVHARDCPDGECRVDHDKVLIECAFGARWGFYKFPPDPADDDPVGGQRLLWRELATPVSVVNCDDDVWLGDDAARVAVGFDLALPLREQLDQAKRLLQSLQRRRRLSGEIGELADPVYRDRLTRMLRLLDAEASAAGEAAMASIDNDWQSLIITARQVSRAGYRRLAHMRT